MRNTVQTQQETIFIRTSKHLLAASLLSLAVACGGGGGDGGDGVETPPPPPPDGGTPAPTPPPPDGGTPAQTLAFIGNEGGTTNGSSELYTVQNDGTDLKLLSSATAAATAAIHSAALSPNGELVAYIARNQSGEGLRLYVVPVTGGTPLEVSDYSEDPSTPGAVASVTRFDWSPDSQQLVFSSTQGNIDYGAREIFVVNADGTGLTRISGSIGDPPVAEVRRPQWSPTGDLVLQEVAGFSVSSGGSRGSGSLNVSDPTVGASSSRRVADSASIEGATWSPDGKFVCFYAEPPNGGRVIGFTDIERGNSNVEYVSRSDRSTSPECAWSGNAESSNRYLAFLERVDKLSGPTEILIKTFTTGDGPPEPEVIVSGVATDTFMENIQWAPESEDHLAYLAKNRSTDEMSLAVTTRAGVVTTLRTNLQPDDAITQYQWSPDGEKIAYLVTTITNEGGDLFTVNRDGSGESLVNSALGSAVVTDFEWADNSEDLTLMVDAIGNNEAATNLYTIKYDGSLVRDVGGSTFDGFFDIAYQGMATNSTAPYDPVDEVPGVPTPTSFTLREIFLLEFPAKKSGGEDWDDPILANVRPDLFVGLRIKGNLADKYESDEKKDAVSGTVYSFKDSFSEFTAPLPQTFEYDETYEISLIDLDDFSNDDLMGVLELNPPAAFAGSDFGTEDVVISKGGIRMRLDIIWNYDD